MLLRRLDENHDMTFGQGVGNFARDQEATAQAVRTRLLLLEEEWFLDTDAGVPWLQRIMVKPTDLPLAEALIKAEILGTEGILSIESFSMAFDRETRALVIGATVRNIYGSIQNIRIVK